MTIKSMTGFAREDGAVEGISWHWEVRTVNSRSLDVRFRLPPGIEGMDQPARQAVAAALTRGSINAQLFVQRTSSGTQIKLNEDALAQVLAASERVRALSGGAPVSTDGVLQVKGVLEIGEPEDEPDVLEARREAMLASLSLALEEVVASRQSEGGKLAVALVAVLDDIEGYVTKIEASPTRAPEAVAQRIGEMIEKLSNGNVALEPERLHQEAVIIAGKADVAEEIQRLRSHLEAAREFLTSKNPVGRKLDFLTQEFNREANTICSKSNDIEVTRIGLALKASIEQMREQVQNIE